jgi:hypothetical protein
MKYIHFLPLPSLHALYFYWFDSLTASPLDSDNSQWYPMHMKHNGAYKTLIRLIDGVFLSYHLIQCKNMVPPAKPLLLSLGATHDRHAATKPVCGVHWVGEMCRWCPPVSLMVMVELVGWRGWYHQGNYDLIIIIIVCWPIKGVWHTLLVPFVQEVDCNL